MKNYYKPDHNWKFSPILKKLALDNIYRILNDPKSTDRAIGIATKNLLQMNKQNIDLDPEVSHQDNQLNINIEVKEVNENDQC